MIKLAGIAAAAVALLFAQTRQKPQEAERDACIQRCLTNVDLDLYRQEIVSLEREAAHAIRLNNGGFFRRVYNDEFTGTLSHGQLVNKADWIKVIESSASKYDSFNASDIKVQIYQDMAVATCLWSARWITKGQPVSHQMRTIHVYFNGASGWHVVSAQITNLPPDVSQLL